MGTLTMGTARAADVVLFDFEGPYLQDPGFSLKDHALFWSGTQWHCFYIRGDEFGNTGTEDELGHAVSDDLRTWTLLPPAVVSGPDPWDSRNVWAPMVIEDPLTPGQRRMLYTGADDLVVQRMGEATSTDTDLLTWAKSPQNPILEPDPAQWVWAPDESFSSFRDPFYFFHDGLHHILHTARVPDATLAGGKRGAVHLATSSDFQTWTQSGPFLVHNSTYAGWHEIESVQLHRDTSSLWHLFFSETNRIGTFHTSSDSLESGWDIEGATEFDQGFAPEINAVAANRYVFSRHAVELHLDGSPFAVIRVDSLSFGSGAPIKIPFDGLADDWPVRTGSVFAAAPTFGDNSLERGEAATLPVGHGYLSSKENYAGPVSGFGAPGASLGEQATGTMKSRNFTLQQSHVRLLVGGSNDPDVFVALMDASTDAILFSARGYDEPTLHPVQWFVGNLTGTSAYLWIEDASTGGYINVDDVRLTTSANIAPVAHDDGSGQPIVTDEETAVAIDVLANDADSDGQLVPVSVTIATMPSNGTVDVDPITGWVTYSPDAGFAGLDTFTYRVSDDAGEPSNEATVFLQVLSPNVDLALTHSVDEPYPLPQQTIVYTVALTNAGPGEATGVAISNPLPSEVTLQSSTTTQGSYDSPSEIWSVGAVPAGGTAILDLEVVLDAQATGVVASTASVIAKDQNDIDPGNDSSNALLFLPTVQTVPLVQDSYLKEDRGGDDTNGAHRDLHCRTDSDRSRQGILQFDLTGIPTGSAIGSAVLEFYVVKPEGSGQAVTIHRTTASWEEESVTWNSTGSAYDAAISGSFAPVPQHVFVNTEITGLVQDWVDGLFPNFGMMLVAPPTGNESKVASKEWSVSSERPTLTVSYLGGSTPPIATDDGQPAPFTTPFQTPLLLDVLINDEDLDGDLVPSSVTVTQPANGGSTVVDPVTGEITYLPALLYSGSDSFQYTVRDDGGNTSNAATVFVEVLPDATAVGAATTRPRLLPSLPNPFNPITSLRVRLTAAAQVEVSIHDMRGRRTLDFPPRALPAGDHQFRWRGQDNRGRDVASGVYSVVLRVNGEIADRQPIVLVR